MKNIKLGTKTIGLGYPAYVVAEIGINHNGSMELAKKTILAAKQSGADAVKFQNYKTENFVPRKDLEYSYIYKGKIIKEYQYDMFKRYELSDKQVIELKEFCDTNNIDFHSTPTNFHGVDLLKRIGVPVLKNGSDYLTNLELVEYMGASKLPTVLSTGMALMSEIEEAVRIFRNTGNEKLILLHCVSRYPTPVEDINLSKIKTLSKLFKTIVGFSDHSEGFLAAACSIIYGASWIEKHFTLDKNLPGPDHIFSCNPKEFTKVTESIRYSEKLMGVPDLGATEYELDSRKNFRLSCAAGKDLNTGDLIENNDIVFIRPGTGILPKNKKILIGRKLKKAVKAFSILSMDDFF